MRYCLEWVYHTILFNTKSDLETDFLSTHIPNKNKGTTNSYFICYAITVRININKYETINTVNFTVQAKKGINA